MIDDRALAHLLTDAVLATDGVIAVFPVNPILHIASEGIASALDLREPEVLVDVERSETLLTITAHIAATSERPTPRTLGDAAEALWEVARREDSAGGEVMVFVKARLIGEPSAGDAPGVNGSADAAGVAGSADAAGVAGSADAAGGAGVADAAGSADVAGMSGSPAVAAQLG